MSQSAPTGLLTLANLGWLLPFLAVGFYGCRISQRPARGSALAKGALAVVALGLLWLLVGADFVHAMFQVGPLSLVPGHEAVASLVSHAVRYALAAAGIAAVWYAVRLVPSQAQKAMSSLGIATLGIYALNSPVLTGMRLLFPAWSVVAGSALTVPVVLAAASAVLALEWSVTLLLARSGVTRRVLLGRWPQRSKEAGG